MNFTHHPLRTAVTTALVMLAASCGSPLEYVDDPPDSPGVVGAVLLARFLEQVEGSGGSDPLDFEFTTSPIASASSSDESVAVIDSLDKGAVYVRGVAEGSAEITAVREEGPEVVFEVKFAEPNEHQFAVPALDSYDSIVGGAQVDLLVTLRKDGEVLDPGELNPVTRLTTDPVDAGRVVNGMLSVESSLELVSEVTQERLAVSVAAVTEIDSFRVVEWTGPTDCRLPTMEFSIGDSSVLYQNPRYRIDISSPGCNAARDSETQQQCVAVGAGEGCNVTVSLPEAGDGTLSVDSMVPSGNLGTF